MSDNSKEIKSYKDKNAYYRQHNEKSAIGCFIYSIITVGLMGLSLYGAYLSLPWLSIGSAGALLILVYNPIRVKKIDVLDNIAKICAKINFIFGFLLIAYGIVCQMTGYRSDFAHLMLSACFFMVIFFINLLSLNSDSGAIRYNQCTERISAQVVDMVSTLDGDGNRVYAPVYEYVYQGARFTEQSPHFTNIKRTLPKIGQICTIMINPDKCQMMFEPYRTPKPVSRWVATATAIFSYVCWIIAYIL